MVFNEWSTNRSAGLLTSISTSVNYVYPYVVITNTTENPSDPNDK